MDNMDPQSLAISERPPCVLLVDDNPTNIDVLYEYLSNEGYEMLVAEDGLSALERVDHILPDLILLDIMMPNMNGYEVCAKLKEREDTREIPVIFITAMGATEDKVKGFRCGCVDYITKPFQNEEVMVRIRTHISLMQMRSKLSSTNDQLAEQNQALNAYARTVAHDLKNPLNLILNFGRLLQEENVLTGEHAQDLESIVQSADRMNHIIQDLLLLAQLRKDEVKPVPVSMAAVVQQSLERLAFTLQSKYAVVEQPDPWVDCMGVGAWIQAVWVNYISNAVKYGGEPPRIRLRCIPSGEMVTYMVEDNGAGIPTEERGQVFEEFSRLGGEKAEGHGIGLSSVKQIIGRLDGEVGVYDVERGSGSCFTFTLPAVPRA
jgi:signal transduction histidine kinase